MSDDKTPPDAEPPAAKRSKLIPLLLVLNLGASGFVAFKTATAHPVVVEHAAAAPEAEAAMGAGPVAPVDSFVVNLNEAGSSRYLKATFELEMTNAEAVDELQKAKRTVRDDVLRYLSSLHVADTLGEDGKAKIQETLVARLDKLLGGNRVRRLYFTDFVVQ